MHLCPRVLLVPLHTPPAHGRLQLQSLSRREDPRLAYKYPPDYTFAAIALPIASVQELRYWRQLQLATCNN